MTQCARMRTRQRTGCLPGPPVSLHVATGPSPGCDRNIVRRTWRRQGSWGLSFFGRTRVTAHSHRRGVVETVLSLPAMVGRINRRFNASIPHNRVWRTVVALGIGEQIAGRWFLRPEDEDTLAEALGLLRPQPAGE